jgi:hypothetical protein
MFSFLSLLFWLKRDEEKDIFGMNKGEFGRKMLQWEECGKRIRKKRECVRIMERFLREERKIDG